MISLDEKLWNQFENILPVPLTSNVTVRVPVVFTQVLYRDLIPFVDDYYASFCSAMRRGLDA